MRWELEISVRAGGLHAAITGVETGIDRRVDAHCHMRGWGLEGIRAGPGDLRAAITGVETGIDGGAVPYKP